MVNKAIRQIALIFDNNLASDSLGFFGQMNHHWIISESHSLFCISLIKDRFQSTILMSAMNISQMHAFPIFCIST